MKRLRLLFAAAALTAASAPPGRAEDPAAQPLLGQPAPEFRLPDLQGRPVELRELRGKIVVLHFGASW